MTKGKKTFSYKLSILLGMMLHFCAASAQIHLESHIENKKTGEALSFASVYIDGGKSTITNIDGDFMIEADSTDILRISYVGYKTIRIPATQVGSTIKLESDDHTLGEVVVLAASFVADKVRKQQKKEMRKNKFIRSNFLYRQTTVTGYKCTTFLEAFFSCHSALELRDLILITGRYCTVASSTTANPINFFTYAQIPHQDDNYQHGKSQLAPFVWEYKNYYNISMETIADDERTIHVLSFVPRENVWALECRLYVDASNYQILRYEGIGKNNYIENRIRGVKHVLPADYSFEVNYRHDKGFAEIESVHFNVGFTDNGKRYTTSGMMYNVDDRVFRLKKTVKFDDNLMQEIQKRGYDPEFWRDKEIVKRTPMEEEIIEFSEQDNLFGVFEN